MYVKAETLGKDGEIRCIMIGLLSCLTAFLPDCIMILKNYRNIMMQGQKIQKAPLELCAVSSKGVFMLIVLFNYSLETVSISATISLKVSSKEISGFQLSSFAILSFEPMMMRLSSGRTNSGLTLVLISVSVMVPTISMISDKGMPLPEQIL